MTHSHGGRWPPVAKVAAVGGAFIAVCLVGVAGSSPTALWAVLFAMPVVLASRLAGGAAGLAGGAIALALVATWAQIKGIDPGIEGYLFAGVGFLVLARLGGFERRGVRGAGAVGSANPVPEVDSSTDHAQPTDGAARPLDSHVHPGLGTWELDLTSGEMQWSEECESVYGLDPDQFVSSRMALQQIVHPEDRELFHEVLDRVGQAAETVEIRHRILRPSDGAERCIRSHVHFRRASAVKPAGLVGTAQDVTDLVLSPREREMLMFLAEGLSGQEIATRLFLSPATVRTHIQNAMVKLGAHTRAQAIATAMRSQEIDG